MSLSRYQQDKTQYRCEWFTAFIRKELGNKKLTTDELAKKIGLAQSTVMSWVTGVRSPGLKTFLMVLDVLGLEIKICEKGDQADGKNR